MAAPASLHQRIDAISKDLESLASETAHDDSSRKKLLGVATNAMAKLEAPVEAVWRIMLMSV